MNKTAGLTSFSSFKNNAIYVIDCLSPDDIQTGKKIYDGLRDLRAGGATQIIERFEVATKERLFQLLDQIAQSANGGIRPIIQFEAHANEEEFGIRDTEPGVSWSELLPLLREINQNAEGNLGVIMSACHGFYALRPLSIKKKAPFYFLIGSQETIDTKQIVDSFTLFYRTLFQTSNLNTSIEAIDITFRKFHSESFAITLAARFIKSKCVGPERQRRIAAYLNQANYLDLSRKKRRALIRRAKDLTRPSRKLFARLTEPFLAKQVRMSRRELRILLRGSRHI